MDGSELLKQESMYAIKAWSFPVWYFSEWINVYIRNRDIINLNRLHSQQR